MKNKKLSSQFINKVSYMKFLLPIVLIIFYGCNTNVEHKTTEKVENHEQQENVLILNNGEKWIIAPEMMAYLQYMKEDINKFDGKTNKEYSNLGIDLSINIDLLTAKCTMKGDAHDQLHLWLVSYIENVNEFAKTENINDASIILIKLKNNFVEFDKYFK